MLIHPVMVLIYFSCTHDSELNEHQVCMIVKQLYWLTVPSELLWSWGLINLFVRIYQDNSKGLCLSTVLDDTRGWQASGIS